MAGIESYLIFYVGSRTLALPVREVDRIVHSVALSPLNEPHPLVAGLINVEGEGVPLYNLRRLFGEDPVDLDLDHRYILFTWQDGQKALWVDGVGEVIKVSPNPIPLPGRGDTSMIFRDHSISITSSMEIMDMAERFFHDRP